MKNILIALFVSALLVACVPGKVQISAEAPAPSKEEVQKKSAPEAAAQPAPVVVVSTPGSPAAPSEVVPDRNHIVRLTDDQVATVALAADDVVDFVAPEIIRIQRDDRITELSVADAEVTVDERQIVVTPTAEEARVTIRRITDATLAAPLLGTP